MRRCMCRRWGHSSGRSDSRVFHRVGNQEAPDRREKQTFKSMAINCMDSWGVRAGTSLFFLFFRLA